MSNEYKDWLRDRVVDVLFDANLIDKATKVDESPANYRLVYGEKNNEKVAFAVWWDPIEKEWRYEHRELNI